MIINSYEFHTFFQKITAKFWKFRYQKKDVGQPYVDVGPSLIPTVYTIIVCIDYILAIMYTVLPDKLQCTYALI